NVVEILRKKNDKEAKAYYYTNPTTLITTDFSEIIVEYWMFIKLIATRYLAYIAIYWINIAFDRPIRHLILLL
ncbi:42581_t:CDS:2, partial [Gigaspora margarita]